MHSKGPFGHLIHFEGHGVFDPEHGKVDIDPGLIDAHNKILDEALVKGLDDNCQVGQGYFFYYTKRDHRNRVATFTGIVVSEDVGVRGKTITFRRLGKTFRGRLVDDADSFNFTRIE